MNIDERIERRWRTGESSLIRDYRALSPVAHVDEPTGRGAVLEQLLDHLEPSFAGRLPPNAYVHGPTGTGKSAVVTALFARLARRSTGQGRQVYTTTRATERSVARFVYVDAREAVTEFDFYRELLDALTDEPAPEHGVSTEELLSRINDLRRRSSVGLVLAVDHVDESATVDGDTLVGRIASLPGHVSWLAIGGTAPEESVLTDYAATTVRIGRYRRQTLTDLLTSRAADGLGNQAFEHRQIRRIAEQAAGDAHDALAALFAAADRAEVANRDTLADEDVAAGLDEVEGTSASLGRVLALPKKKQLLLRKLIDLDDGRYSVSELTERLSDLPDVDLSPSTVMRYLYEIAENDVVERVSESTSTGVGRPPSRIALRFPPTVFRRLYDQRE
jgi:Cdc6-like AAA superfamily ATPase